MVKRTLDRISLNALRVFYVCGKNMNFSAAARELLVSQAAVSRRIKNLEDELGYDLFIRNGRQLCFSQRGEQLFFRLHDLLGSLSDTLEFLADETASTPITIAAGNSISHLWLNDKLRKFAAEHSDVPLRVHSTDTLSEITDTANDLAIIYCAGSCPGWSLTPLLLEELAPVAAPQYLQSAGLGKHPADVTPSELLQLDLHDYMLSDSRWLNLQSWMNRVSGREATLTPTAIYPTYMMALDAALEGQGVVLGSRALIAPYLANHDLTEVTSNVLRTGFSYNLGYPRDEKPTGAIELLYNQLMLDR